MTTLAEVHDTGLLANLPDAGMEGRYFYAEDEQILYRDNGVAWVQMPFAGSGGGSESSTYATRPAAGNEGTLFLPTDGPYIERDTGAAWQSWGPLYRMTPPVDADFTWVNQDSATVTTTNGGVYIESPGQAGNEFHIRYKSAPATPYSVTAYLVPRIGLSAVFEYGICFRQSSDGKLAVFGVQGAGITGAPYLYSAKVASPIVGTVNYLATQYLEFSQPQFLRIADNGTNRICSMSRDGIHFTTFQSVGRTDYLTADQVGFYVRDPASGSVGAWLLSWEQS